MSPSVGSKLPAIERRSVDLPRPFAATMPRRSPGSMERLRLENSGAPSVTPRDRRLIKAMFVLWPGGNDAGKPWEWARHHHEGQTRKEIRFGVSSVVSPANAFAGRGQGRADDGDQT